MYKLVLFLILVSSTMLQVAAQGVADGSDVRCDSSGGECDIPESIKVGLTETDEVQCGRWGSCWNDRTCFTERPRRCDIPQALRKRCGPIIAGEQLCRRSGCCWEEEAWPSCFTRRHRCDIPDDEREDCGPDNPFQCRRTGCCWDPYCASKCYRKIGCNPRERVYGKCSKTCGFGIRIVRNGCGKFICWQRCCDKPCPGPGLLPSRPPFCKNYPPANGQP